MGYTTEFSGEFSITPVMKSEHLNELKSFVGKRHGGDIDPFEGMPGLWCDWEPSEDGSKLRWNGSEKFYNYIEWLEYLIESKLHTHGYKVNGSVKWRGEDFEDFGVINVKDSIVDAQKL